MSCTHSMPLLLLVQRLAQRLAHGDETVAAKTLLITASSLYWAGFTGAVMFDVMLVFFVLVAVSGVEWAARGAGLKAWSLTGAALGAGILTKGPVALLHVLPLALLAPWWMGQPPARWRGWYAGIGLAVLVAAMIALAWALPAAVTARGGIGPEIFWSQSADRIVATTHHARPYWFYLPGIAVLSAPWLLWPSLWRGLAALRHAAVPGVRFSIAWCVLPIVAHPLLGAQRAGDLAVNVILPWLWSRAAAGNHQAAMERAERRYFTWPRTGDNAILRRARTRLLAGGSSCCLRTAAFQQGLLQIVRDFCDHSNALCAECPFPRLVRELGGETSSPEPGETGAA